MLFCGTKVPEKDLDEIAERAMDDLASLKGGHVFLTGGTAFFGKWLLESLVHAEKAYRLGYCITVQSRSPESFYEAMHHLRGEGIISFWRGALPRLRPQDVRGVTHVIHAANYPATGRKDYALRHARFAVDGSRAVQEMAESNPVRSVLLVSSGGAYRAEPVPMSEHVPTSDDRKLRELQDSPADNVKEPTVYGVTKRFLEVLWTAWGSARNVRVPVARCFSFIGPHMPLENAQAVGNFLSDAASGRNIVVKGDGTAVRTYMYGTDLVVWMLALLARGRHGVPYNVGSDEAVSIRRLAEAVAGHAVPPVHVDVLGKATEGNAPDRYVPDTARAKSELGLECRHALDESIARCFAAVRSSQGNVRDFLGA